MDAIAEQASASKATIYRWWSSKHELAFDALLLEWEGLSGLGRDTGSLRGDLLAIVRPWVKLVSSRPYGRVIAELVAHAHRDDAFARSWRERFLDVRRRRGRAASCVRSSAARLRWRRMWNSPSTCFSDRSTIASSTATHR